MAIRFFIHPPQKQLPVEVALAVCGKHISCQFWLLSVRESNLRPRLLLAPGPAIQCVKNSAEFLPQARFMKGRTKGQDVAGCFEVH